MNENKKKNTQVEIPVVGEPLVNPNFVKTTSYTVPPRDLFRSVPERERYAKEPEVGSNFLLDPLGSWTGRPLDSTEEPVQDADDL